MRFILASESPRRKELLASIGIDFETLPSSVPELDGNGSYSPHVPFLNAILKAETVALKHPDALVLGADTVIEFENKIMGKPRDMSEACEMLMTLSGKKHNVTTAVCLRNILFRVESVFCETTVVEFNAFERDTAEKYISSVHTLDKAGAYAIQELGSLLVKNIRGPEDNVIGLPRKKLRKSIYACGFGSLITKDEPPVKAVSQ